jgi:hypothetical protein
MSIWPISGGHSLLSGMMRGPPWLCMGSAPRDAASREVQPNKPTEPLESWSPQLWTSYGIDTNSKELNLTLLSATSSLKTSSAFPFFAERS